LTAIQETRGGRATSQEADGGDVMKSITLAVVLALVAVSGTAAPWADSSPTMTSTDQAP
jgi:hypothetical protein